MSDDKPILIDRNAIEKRLADIYEKSNKDQRAALSLLWAGITSLPSVEVKPRLAKHQPCGCVVCTCEDEEQCHGCGAKSCGTHPIGNIPTPVYETESKSADEDIRAKMAAIVFHAAGRPLTEDENLKIVDLALSVSGPAKNKWDFITALCRRAYETSKAHGWKHDNDGQAIALMHSELSEALEAMRKPGCKDEHLPDLDPVGLELADVLIRVFDFCGARGIDLATCLKEKMDYNDRRPMKHGGKLF